MFTDLSHVGIGLETTEAAISSLMDTWILLRDIESSGERNRGIYILKSRGMAHSNQIREFLLTDKGIKLADVYIGPGGVLTGSARMTQEAQEKAEALLRQEEIEGWQASLERKRQAMEAQVAALRAGFEAEEIAAKKTFAQAKLRQKTLLTDQQDLLKMRKGNKD